MSKPSNFRHDCFKLEQPHYFSFQKVLIPKHQNRVFFCPKWSLCECFLKADTVYDMAFFSNSHWMYLHFEMTFLHSAFHNYWPSDCQETKHAHIRCDVGDKSQWMHVVSVKSQLHESSYWNNMTQWILSAPSLFGCAVNRCTRCSSILTQ